MKTLPGNLNKFGPTQSLKTAFVNNHKHKIILWEEDYDGQEKLVGTYEPGQEFDHTTVQGKVVRAYSAEGNQLLLEYMPGVKVIENLNGADLAPASVPPAVWAKPARRQEVNQGFREKGEFAKPPPPVLATSFCGFCFYNALPVKVKVFFTGDGIHEQADTEPDPGYTWCGCTAPDSQWVVRNIAGAEIMRPSFRKVLIPHSCGLPKGSTMLLRGKNTRSRSVGQTNRSVGLWQTYQGMFVNAKPSNVTSLQQTNEARTLRGKFAKTGGNLIPKMN